MKVFSTKRLVNQQQIIAVADPPSNYGTQTNSICDSYNRKMRKVKQASFHWSYMVGIGFYFMCVYLLVQKKTKIEENCCSHVFGPQKAIDFDLFRL